MMASARPALAGSAASIRDHSKRGTARPRSSVVLIEAARMVEWYRLVGGLQGRHTPGAAAVADHTAVIGGFARIEVSRACRAQRFAECCAGDRPCGGLGRTLECPAYLQCVQRQG